MSIVSLALKLAAPTPKIESFQRFLFIGPHPDAQTIHKGSPQTEASL